MIVFIIFLSFWLGLSLSSAYIALSITAIVFLLFLYKRFSKITAVLSLVFIASGFLLSFCQVSFQKNVYHGLVYEAKENYILLNAGGERLYVHIKNHQYDIGDILTVEGEKEDLSFNRLESAFDFEKYLNKRGVFKAFKAKKVVVNFRNFIRLKQRREKLLKMFNQEERSIIGAILFSDGEDSDLSTSLKELHLARFLSASGIFISAFYFVFNKLFSLFLKDKYSEGVSIMLLLLYGVFTFPRFSVIKVLLFLSVKWINKHLLKNKFSYLSLIGGTGLFCLLMNPYLARQDAFILGFLIPIISYLTRYIDSHNKIKYRLKRYIFIYLFFLPFEINYYNKVVILSLPLQIISSPIFILIGIISLFCFFYIPIYKANTFLIYILSKYASFIRPLSFGLYFDELNQFIMLIYYALYFFFLYYASLDFKPLKRAFLSAQIIFISLLALPINNSISQEVCFVNVGQGDCTFIRDHHHVALIDTGGLSYLDLANQSLIPFLKKKKIYHIDMVFITHYDFDHYGALEELKKSYKINNVYDYHSFFPIKMGNITFNNHNYYWSNDKEENDKSLVISFNSCQKDFLVMGDAPSYVEKQIIKNEEHLSCDILRVGHHGSNTSTSEEWIKYLNPETAIISVGKDNKYAHPNQEVLNLLNKYKIKIRRTDIEGTITYKKISFN